MESTAKIIQAQKVSNIIPFSFVVEEHKNNIEENITHCNKPSLSGKSCEVYAFRTEEEIQKMIEVLDQHIVNALDENKRQIAYRNKLLFVIGINVGLRASDLRLLKYSFFFEVNDNYNIVFKDYYTIQPKKTKKTKKFVKIFLNQTVKKMITDYINEYPVNDLNDYLFISRKGDEPILERTLWRIIKETADEAGIKQNIGSHSLRKTWGYWCWHNAEDKNKALVILQECFNHSSSLTTMKYIGLVDEEKSEMYNSIELGFDYI